MSSNPNASRLLKAALVGVDPFNPLASVVVFQYNPETLTRTLTARAAGAQANRGEALRLAGPPEGEHQPDDGTEWCRQTD